MKRLLLFAVLCAFLVLSAVVVGSSEWFHRSPPTEPPHVPVSPPTLPAPPAHEDHTVLSSVPAIDDRRPEKSLSPEDRARRDAALALNEEGVRLAEQGDLEGALTKLVEALARFEDEPTIKANAAKVHAAIGKKDFEARKFPEAASEFRTASEMCPEELEYVHLHGVALAASGSDRDAIATFERILEKKPDRVATLVALGQALYRTGRNKEAIARWERASQLAPDDQEIKDLLAKARKEESVEGDMGDLGFQHFTIKFDGKGDPEIGRLVGRVLEDAYRDVGYDLQRYPSGETPVVVYPKKAFRTVTGSHSWVAALYDGKIRVPGEGIDVAHGAEVKRVLTHEYTHALIRSVAGANVPAWLHEGIAQVEEGRTRADARAALAGKPLPALDELTGTFINDSDTNRVRVRYATAFDFVASLAEKRGKTTLSEVLDRLGRGEKLDDAMRAVYGASVTQLYDEWKQAR